MAQGFILSAADRDALAGLLAEARRQSASTVNRPAVGWEEHQAPETYVALTPLGGIPALTEGPDTGTAEGIGDIPGHADCDIYQLITSSGVDQLVKAGVQRRVYNLAQTAISGTNWVVVTRDKFGRWFAASVQTDVSPQSGAGCGCWAGVRSYCLRVDLISTGIGECACIPTLQGPWYLVNGGDNLSWSQVDDPLVNVLNFKTCCLSGGGYEDTGLFVFGVDPNDNYEPYLYLQGTFPSCRFTTGTSGPSGTGTHDLSGNVTDPRFAFDYCAVGPVAYFRGSGSTFCNGSSVANACENTFILKVSQAGSLDCIPPLLLGCCPDIPLPGEFTAHISAIGDTSAWQYQILGDFTFINPGGSLYWTAHFLNPDGTTGTLTAFCGSGFEYPAASGIWHPRMDFHVDAWPPFPGTDPHQRPAGLFTDTSGGFEGSGALSFCSPLTGRSYNDILPAAPPEFIVDWTE